MQKDLTCNNNIISIFDNQNEIKMCGAKAVVKLMDITKKKQLTANKASLDEIQSLMPTESINPVNNISKNNMSLSPQKRNNIDSFDQEILKNRIMNKRKGHTKYICTKKMIKLASSPSTIHENETSEMSRLSTPTNISFNIDTSNFNGPSKSPKNDTQEISNVNNNMHPDQTYFGLDATPPPLLFNSEDEGNNHIHILLLKLSNDSYLTASNFCGHISGSFSTVNENSPIRAAHGSNGINWDSSDDDIQNEMLKSGKYFFSYLIKILQIF